MGIVLKQSFINTLIIYLSFALGGINVLILYPQVLEGKYHGIVVYLLSVSNIIMPLAALGVHHTIVKYFSSYNNKIEKDKFLSSIVFLPLLIAIPLGFFVSEFYNQIGNRISQQNPILKDYTFVIFIVAISKSHGGKGGGNRGNRSQGKSILEAIILSNMGRGSYSRGSSTGGFGGFGGNTLQKPSFYITANNPQFLIVARGYNVMELEIAQLGENELTLKNSTSYILT